jgi:hypothetical protein
MLIGKVEENGSVIRGEWTHVDGPLLNGSFEMASNADGEYSGWWEDGSRDVEVAEAAPRQEWSWARAAQAELRASVIGSGLRASLGFIEKPPELLPPNMDLKDSMSCFEDPIELQSPIDKVGCPQSKDSAELQLHVDEVVRLHIKEDCLGRFEKFLASVYMDRLTMFASWLFFIFTATQLLLELWGPITMRMFLNFVFNIVYSCFYFFFLVAYACAEKPPSPAYIIGVAFYFLGYMAFAVIYAWAFFDNAEVAQWYSPIMYHEGAWAFLLGSVLLTFATRRVESLFCGSLSFLFGSLVFSIDAMIHYPKLISAGYTMFAFGRVFFVKGSETPRCDMRFRESAAANNAAS